MTKIRDIDDIDPGIIEVCELFNRMPGVNTSSSCEGHPRGAHIYFGSEYYPGWLWDVMNGISEDTDFCMGCCGIRWGYRAYYDCVHTPIDFWYFEINPYNRVVLTKDEVDSIWKSVKKTLKRILGE